MRSTNVRKIRESLVASPMTVPQLSNTTGLGRPTVSAAIYNMKRRGEVEHDMDTGVYRLSDGAPVSKRIRSLDVSLRDYFAGQALVKVGHPLMEYPHSSGGIDRDVELRRIGTDCYAIADAMLKARSEAQ
jgi:hypothetical protein